MQHALLRENQICIMSGQVTRAYIPNTFRFVFGGENKHELWECIGTCLEVSRRREGSRLIFLEANACPTRALIFTAEMRL